MLSRLYKSANLIRPCVHIYIIYRDLGQCVCAELIKLQQRTEEGQMVLAHDFGDLHPSSGSKIVFHVL